MLRAILIDDEENGRLSLRRKLENYCPDVEVVGQAGGAKDGLALIDDLHPDIVFLDIEMPRVNGFEMLDQLMDQLKPMDFHLVFTTAHDHYAIEAIKKDASDYLLKPVDIEELKTCVAKILRTQAQRELAKASVPSSVINASPGPSRKTGNRITIPTMEGLMFLNLEEIMHIEAQSNYTVFHFTEQPKLTVSKTLKEIEDMLPPDRFFRIHHSHIVNLNFIKKYVRSNGGHLELKDGTQVDVSRRKRDEFLKLIGY